jgi:sugar O-acyltransferase (sialic acid O-acetyltransferase NeuD family)
MYKNLLKRSIDFILATTAFIVSLPIFAIITLCLYFANRGKPFFLQRRPGIHNNIFRVVKFKTMNDLRDSDGNLLPDEKRLTAIGNFVRKTSLDEIPQLLNVIKGDMSLIGPRPLLEEYLPIYNEKQRRRHEVRPGITGWAQVNGRNAISWQDKFKYDVWYVDNMSFMLDLKIIFLTISKVFKSEGISADGNFREANNMYLFGASGHAKVIMDILNSMSIAVSGLFDDNPVVKELNSQPVLGKYQGQEIDAGLIISIGDNKIRAKIAVQLQVQYGKAIDKSAIVSDSVRIDEGTVVMQGAVIQASSSIGKHAIVNTKSSIDHDCLISNFVHVSPGAVLCGNVQVGEGTHIGAGAIVLPNLKIGKWCKIGAGAVVIRDIPDFSTAVGNPARIIKCDNDE